MTGQCRTQLFDRILLLNATQFYNKFDYDRFKIDPNFFRIENDEECSIRSEKTLVSP